MTEPSQLATALMAFQSQMPTVHKGKTANVPTKTGGSYSYSYADLADVTAAAIPLLTQHGLTFTAQPRRTDQGDYELVGVLLHISGERETGSLPIHGRSAQEIGSSLTYGRRYLLGCMTGIVTDDDDDAASAPAERTRRAPTPAEDAEAKRVEAERLLNVARGTVKEAWEAKHGTFDLAAMREAYEQHTAQPLDAATPADLVDFAAHLRSNA